MGIQERYSLSKTQEDLSQVDNPARREFLGQLVKFLGTVALTSSSATIGSKISEFFERVRDKEVLKSSTPQFGVNIRPEALHWFGLDQKDALETLFTLPATERLRIAVPFDQVAKTDGGWDVKVREKLIEETLAQGKGIDLQLGIKTIGWPEAHLPDWLVNYFPYLVQRGEILDKDPRVQELFLEYVDRTADFYLRYQGIKSVQVENEVGSKRLPITKYRRISIDFNEREVTAVRKYIQKHRQGQIPILQNFPFDTPEAWLYVLRNSDIIGLNIYNQQEGESVPENFLWGAADVASRISRILKKQVFITEFQSAAWIDENKKPVYPFTPEKRQEGLQKIVKLKPDAILLWDVEQLLWRTKNGEKEHLEFLNSLPEAA
ncbi:hypothetical protein HY439_03330 [Candidatus Microgenomates bacterium]|nr:hypothetical protein [Candidatus Microgenomates bacterium]